MTQLQPATPTPALVPNPLVAPLPRGKLREGAQTAREVASDFHGAVPALTPLTHIAYLWGLEDAQAGRLCCPEMLFARRVQVIAYATGYALIRQNDTTKLLLGGLQ